MMTMFLVCCCMAEIIVMPALSSIITSLSYRRHYNFGSLQHLHNVVNQLLRADLALLL